ncbi:MAG: PTS sugar transporter subunit IIB [Candidatus Coatesbacteria bacterium]|nr:MAG: PTS sugar transporter subunit IIB [Candidatus Coatesbacteria bacterium]
MIGDPFRDTEQYKRYGVLLARIDDRLVHGQVVVGWNSVVCARFIVACNDRVAGDEFARTIIETASAPSDITVIALSVNEAAAETSSGVFRDGGAILLFESPADVLRVLDAGVELDRVNLGGMHQKPGKTEVATAIWLDDGDRTNLRTLVERSARVTAQMVPTEPEKGIEVILDSAACREGSG